MTVGTALLTSLALALTWTPTLSHYLLKRKPENNAETADAHGHVSATGFMGRVTAFYISTLRFVLARPLVLALGLFAGCSSKTETPAADASMAARRPAPPAPITSTSCWCV